MPLSLVPQFLVFSEDWLSLGQEEEGIVLELWKLEDEVDQRDQYRSSTLLI